MMHVHCLSDLCGSVRCSKILYYFFYFIHFDHCDLFLIVIVIYFHVYLSEDVLNCARAELFRLYLQLLNKEKI